MDKAEGRLKILVVSSVFPNRKQPNLGIFVRERMLHVARHSDVKVMAPVPWFPFARFLKKGYRPLVQKNENQEGLKVFHPKFFNIPGLFKCFDGILFFLSSLRTVYDIRKKFKFDLIDAHFAYPDGLGAVLLGIIFQTPVTITLRGTVVPLSKYRLRRFQIIYALKKAKRVFSVCAALKYKAVNLGTPADKIVVIPNGIDTEKFKPLDKLEIRKELNLPLDKKIIISVGGLVERKGFQDIISILPSILRKFPDIYLVIVGGISVEGNFKPELERLIEKLNVNDYVFFAGSVPHNEVYKWINASDVFCLATKNEGWANVFLEALACGKPVVTTSVGGNSEVIKNSDLGILVNPEEKTNMEKALFKALDKEWNTEKLIGYACQNSWEKAANAIMKNFEEIKND